MVSEVAFASARYSVSMEDLATALRFFELQEIGVDPRKLMYAEVEVWSSTFPAQSASEKVVKRGKPDLEICIP